MLFALNNCYKTIPMVTAGELIQKRKPEEIDSLTTEYKDLLNLENWDDIYRSKDPSEISDEIRVLQEKLENLNKKSDEQGDEDRPRDEEEQMKQDIPIDHRSQKDKVNVFGVNINELSPNTKNILGFGLLFLVLGVFIYGIMKVVKEMKRPEKKKKKDKKNK
jgi:hypothetical protein